MTRMWLLEGEPVVVFLRVGMLVAGAVTLAAGIVVFAF